LTTSCLSKITCHNNYFAANSQFNYFRSHKGTYMRTFLLAALFIYSGYASAQTIRVVDIKTDLPIENVAVLNLDKSVAQYTNASGEVDLTSFEASAYITFLHPAYQEYVIQKSSINASVIQLSERIIKMKDVVISANKWEQDADEIPNQIVSITPNEIAFNNPQTAADMLEQTGQVFMQKSQFGGGSPKLRGFAANSVLIVVDGVRMNNAIYRGGNLQNVINIDPNALAGSEVILGPGSVMYGSDALGGVMDFHVKDPKFSIGDKLRTAGSAFTRYASASNERTVHADVNLGGKKLAWYSSLSYSQLGDLEAGSHRPKGYPNFGKKPFLVAQDFNGNDILITNPHPDTQSPSGFESWNVIEKLGYKPSKHLNLTYNFYLSNTSNIPRYDRLIELDANGIPNDAEWYYGPQKWAMNSLKTTFTRSTLLFDQAKLIVAYQDYKESRNDRGFGDDRLRTRKEEVDLWSFNLDVDKQFEHGNLFYGLEYLTNDVRSSAIRVNQNTSEVSFPDTRYPDGGSSYASYAAYLNHQWNISPNFILNTGIRYTAVDIKAKYNNTGALNFPFEQFKLNNGAFNGSLGLVFNPNERLKTSLSLSSGFRSPNIDDVGKLFDFSDGEVQVPNTGLQPEYAYNSEFGWEYKFSEILEIGGSVFYTYVDNAMVRQNFSLNGQDSIIFDGTLSKVVALQNTGSAEIYGYHFEMEAFLTDHWALEGSITNTLGKDNSNDEPLRHTTPLFGKFSVIYQNNKFRGEFYTMFNGNRLRADIPGSEIDDKPHLYAIHQTDRSKDGSPAWSTLNIKGSYQLTPYFSLNVGVENIFDRHYRPYSSGISAPGRNIVMALRAQF